MSIETYPTSISTLGSVNQWSESRQTDTVLVSTSRPGLAFMDVIRTFDPITFVHTIPNLTTTLRDTLKDFYSDNKTKEFYWTHPRTLTIYLLMFDTAPIFNLNNDIDSWNVIQQMTQSSSYTA